jgi:hypothetical protein
MGRRRADIWDGFFEAMRWLFTVVHPAWSILVAACFFFIPARRQRAAFLQQHLDIDWLNELSWQDERQAAEVYRQQGYWVEKLGGGGADGGIDLRLHRDGLTIARPCELSGKQGSGTDGRGRTLFAVSDAMGRRHSSLLSFGKKVCHPLKSSHR